MTAPISDAVQITVVPAPSPASQVGFGLPLILSHSAAWAERTRVYSSIIAVGLDFATTTPEYLAAAKLFGQTPRPPQILIGRAANVPTFSMDVTPIAVNNHVYSFKVGGQLVTYTSDGTATLAEIIVGLKAALDALALPVTVSNIGPNTLMRVVENVAGAWRNFDFGASPDANLSPAVLHADPGVAADLAAIRLERSDWSALVTLFNSAALVTAAAAWAQSVGVFYAPQVIDGAVPNTAPGGGDIAQVLKTANQNHVITIFSPGMGDFLDAGILGACLPLLPGSETWKWKAPAGVNSGSYTDTQRSNLRGKNCNFLEPMAGVPVFMEGVVSSGAFIDTIRYQDYASAQFGLIAFNVMRTPPKMPYNDRGISVMKRGLQAFCDGDVVREALRDTPAPTVTIPKAADQTSGDRTIRKLNSIQIAVVYAGAIHDVAMTFTLSV